MAKGERDLTSVGSRLSKRLRALREEIPGLTQKQLAKALGGEGTMVSMWETSRRLPAEEQLTAYARLFATRRSFSGQGPPRTIADTDLTEEERGRFEQLKGELLDLREEADKSGTTTRSDPTPRSGVFHFNDGAPVTVICADVPKEDRPSFADPADLNYVRASSFADLDAVIDAFGHLRAENRGKDVRIRAASELHKEVMLGHLVLIGGRAWNEATEWFSDQVGLPVSQRTVKGEEVFAADDGHEVHEFRIERGDNDLLVQDVGLFARTPNPLDPSCTLTICSGITTRGVRGAVLCFADPGLRAHNERYVATRFGLRIPFLLLFKVPVLPMSGESLAPDLTKADTRLFEWDNDESGPA